MTKLFRKTTFAFFLVPALMGMAIVARPPGARAFKKDIPVAPQVSQPGPRPRGGPQPQFQKVGDTILPWQKTWGYASATQAPKARLWWMSDPEMKATDWVTESAGGASSVSWSSQSAGGSPMPIGDIYTQEVEDHLQGQVSLAGQATAISIPGDLYSPVDLGHPVEVQAQVDVKTQEVVQVALCVATSSCAYRTNWVSVQSQGSSNDGWTRVHLPSILSAATLMFGSGANPLVATQPFRFGLAITTSQSQKPISFKLDNFEVRVAAKCTKEMRQRELAELNRIRSANLSSARGASVVPRAARGGVKSLKGINAAEMALELKENDLTREELAQLAKLGWKRTSGLPTSAQCCDLDDVAPTKDGFNINEPGAEVLGNAQANFVEEEVPLEDAVSNADTSTDDWLKNFPCKPKGDTLPGDLDSWNDDINAGNLPEEFKDLDLPDVPSDLEEQEWQDAEKDLESDKEDDETAVCTQPKLMDPNNPDGPLAPNNPARPQWRPSGDDRYCFDGMDIVFVHGLKLQHLLDGAINGDKAALTSWSFPENPTAANIIASNPQYFGNGYFASQARQYFFGDKSLSESQVSAQYPSFRASSTLTASNGVNWDPSLPQDGHIWRFLLGNGYRNRFIVVGYNCNDRMDVAAKAVLAQVSLAMTEGIGVYNPSKHTGTNTTLWSPAPGGAPTPLSGFGSRGIVFVSHSTGGPVVDIAMYKGFFKKSLGARHVVTHTKAHVACSGAFGGSGLAAWASFTSWLSRALDSHGLFRFVLSSVYPDAPGIDSLKAADMHRQVKKTILQDLRPSIMFLKHRLKLMLTPIPVLLVQSAHPTSIMKAKYIVHPGFDDNTVSASSEGAHAAPSLYWPHGVYALNHGYNFDLGLFGPEVKVPPIKIFGNFITVTIGTTYTGQPVRAIGYFLDQRIDPFITRPWLLTDPNVRRLFEACYVSPFVSPSGMLLQAIPTLIAGDPTNPYWRIRRHWTVLQSAGDHFEIVSDRGTSVYSAGGPKLPGAEAHGGVGGKTFGPDIKYPEYEESPENPLGSLNSGAKNLVEKLLGTLGLNALGGSAGYERAEKNREESRTILNPRVWLPTVTPLAIPSKWSVPLVKWGSLQKT